MKAKDILTRIGIGLKKSAPTIGTAIAAVVVGAGYAILCEKLGIPISTGGSSYRSNTYNSQPQVFPGAAIFMMPRNTAESKIMALKRDAIECFFDSDRCNIAEDIFEIASTSGDESTKQFAINILQEISHQMNFGGGRATISELIKEM